MIKRHYLIFLISVAFIGVWLSIITIGSYPGPVGGDFYQLWLGARYLLEGDTPYGMGVHDEMSMAYGKWGQHGLPYPLPALMLVAPLALLPVTVALAVWMALSLTAVGSMAFLQKVWYHSLALPFLFIPLFRTASLRQPTLMWLGLAVILVLALQRRWSIVAGLCLAILPAKPQAGLIFALAGAVWAFRYQRSALRWAIVWGVLLWGGSIVLVPSWVGNVLSSMVEYREIYTTRWLFPVGFIAILAAYRLPWWGIAAAAQAVLFPLHDVYGMLPIILGWAAIGGPLALFGASLSLNWVVFSYMSFIPRLWISIILPFTLAAFWRSYGEGWVRQWRTRRRDAEILPAISSTE